MVGCLGRGQLNYHLKSTALLAYGSAIVLLLCLPYPTARTPLPQRTFGGASLPVVGVGTWSFGSAEGEYWGLREQTATNEVVASALEYGTTLFDTAEAYQSGRSESALAEAIKAAGDVGKDAVVATKILPSNCKTPEAIREHLDASLQRLDASSVYLYQVHWPLNESEVGPAFAELAAQQKAGKIQHIGVSNFGVKQMTAALATGVKIATNQLCYNLLTRGIEFELLPLLKKHDIGVIAYSPLLQGLLTDKGVAVDSFDGLDPHRLRTRHFKGSRDMSRHEGPGHEGIMLSTLHKIKDIASKAGMSVPRLAIAWTLANEQVMSVIPGASSPKQLHNNMAASAPLDAAIKAELDAITDELKQAMGTALDIYQSDAGQRVE